MAEARQMKISAFLQGGGSYHQAGWRHPEARSYANDVRLWIDMAKRLEAATFDMIFIADILSPQDSGIPDIFPYNSAADRFEPLTILSAIATHSRHIGLAGTAATSYAAPFDVARQFRSLDLISGGRAGWNIVTGIAPEDASQYGSEHLLQSERYERGEEHVDVVIKLWNSVQPGAFPHHKESGVYVDTDKIGEIHHKGKYFSVRGPMNIEPSPQGRPLLIQAGQSEDGRALSSRVAEAVFTAQSRLDLAQAYYADIKARVAAWGRNPDHLKVLPGVMPFVGTSRAEAEDKMEAVNALIDLRPARTRLEMALKFVDLRGLDLDAPFPEMPPEAGVSRGANHIATAREKGLTLREVLILSSQANAHRVIHGTPADIADQLDEWFSGGAADGFNIMPAVSPTTFEEFSDMVVPELRRRGLFRERYEGTTLRENLGIPLEPIPVRH